MAPRELLTEDVAAKRIGMSTAFLRMARLRGVVGGRTPAPAFLKLGRSVRYDAVDLDHWLQARRIDPSARKPSRKSR
jgi:hypothetical protein